MSENSFFYSPQPWHFTRLASSPLLEQGVSSDLLLIVTEMKAFINFSGKNIYIVVRLTSSLNYNMLSRLRGEFQKGNKTA